MKRRTRRYNIERPLNPIPPRRRAVQGMVSCEIGVPKLTSGAMTDVKHLDPFLFFLDAIDLDMSPMAIEQVPQLASLANQGASVRLLCQA
jgi:hypothetical protein